jgi:hypothetical protein
MHPFYVLIKEYLQTLKQNSKKRINVKELEELVINSLHTKEEYQKLNGYYSFFDSIQQLNKEGILIPMKKNIANGRNPFLPLYWWYIPAVVESRWDQIRLLQMSDKLNLHYYKSNPSFQTEIEWKRILAVYDFLNNAKNRVVISREERSYELFNDEKFLSEKKGKNFITRLGLGLEDLKAEIYGEPFVFWLKPGSSLLNINNVLIVENKSFFHTCVKLMKSNQLELNPQLLIYGEGKHIENSFSFFYEMFPNKEYNIFYAGDIDPEGWGIYYRLSKNFPHSTFKLAIPLYKKMIGFFDKANIVDHIKNKKHLDFIKNELDLNGEKGLEETILNLWSQKRRIPQEVLTIETLTKGGVIEEDE